MANIVRTVKNENPSNPGLTTYYDDNTSVFSKEQKNAQGLTANQMSDYASGKIDLQGNAATKPKTEPYLTRDGSSGLVGGSGAITSQKDQLQKDYDALLRSQEPATPIAAGLTPTEQAYADLQASAKSIGSTSSVEEQRIKAAGEAASAQYAPLIQQAQAAKGKGLGIAEISAGEAGGFMNTQFVGAAGEAGLSKAGGIAMGRYGTGGELTRIKSEYDANINTLEAQRLAAIATAENAMRTFIQTGKQSEFDNSYKMFQAAESAAKAKTDAANALADNLQKQLNYQLELDKFAQTQYTDAQKAIIDAKKLDVDIAGVTGKWTDGTKTLAAKKADVDEMYKKLGYDLDIKKFDWTMNTDTLKQDLEQKKYDLEKSKVDAVNAGVNIDQSVQDALNGLGGIEKGQPGYQAYKAKLNQARTIYKDEGQKTGNAYYDIKGSAGASGGGLTSTQSDALSKVFAVYPQLQDLKALFDKLKADGKTGAWVGAIKNKDFTDPYVAQFKAQLAGIIPTVARGIYGEVGVLTDNDINNYSRAVAKINNPDEASDAIFNNMLKTLETKASSYLKVAANNNKDVSGFADDYQALVSSIRSATNQTMPTISDNPAVYDSMDEWATSYRNTYGDAAYTTIFADKVAGDMEAARIKDVNDYFQFLKDSSMGKETLQNIPAKGDSSGGGDTGAGIKPTFKSVGADTNKGVGSLSQKYESGGNPGAIGYDSTGGYSYGVYQMAHNTAQSFINNSKYAKDFKGLTFNSPEWQAKWKDIAKKDPSGFSSAQENYITQKYYTPQLEKVVNAGIDISKFSPALGEVIKSTAVQHGVNTDVIVKAYNDAKKILGREPNDAEFITQIYNERWSGGRRFASSTPEVQKAVKNRLIAERKDALKLI